MRTIADFKRENLITTEKKKIRVLDHAGLVEAAGQVVSLWSRDLHTCQGT